MESNLCIQASRETGLHAPALSMAGTVDINPVPTTLSAHHGQESESESAKRTSVQTDGSAFSTVMSAADAFQKEMSLVDSLEAPEPTVTRHSTSHDDTKGEAFPDYYESCEMNTQLVDSAHEEAYNYAMSKVAEEVIRFREVDTGVTALPSLSTFQAHDMVADEDQGDSDEEDRETEIWGPAAGDINKLTALEGLARLLIQPDLKPSTQKRFMSITNMAVRMEYLLFSQHGPDTEMKLTERDVWELNVMASEMVRYLTSVDDKLRGLVDDAYRVVCVLSAAAKDRRTSAWLRYKRMALIVMR